MNAATYTRVEVAEKLGISEARVRQLLAVVSERIEDTTADNRITEAGFNAIVSYREMGRAAWLNAHPIAPVAPEAPAPQPEPQPVAPQSVYEMDTNPGHQLTTQAQPSQPAFTVIDGGRLAPIPVGSMTTAIAQPQALMPIPLVTGQIANTANSAAAATAAARQMVSALRDRLTMGLDAIDQQDLQSRQAITALETELADLETIAAEYQQTARSAQIRENLRADRVGKLTNRLAETGSLAGFQLQPLSS